MGELVPLYRVHEAIFGFCRGRTDLAVFGAQAVNVYVTTPRMTQDVDLFATDPSRVAEELAAALHDALGIAARVREMRPGVGYRVYQSRKDGNRHLADVRLAEIAIEECPERGGIRYVPIVVTVAMKVRAYVHRRLAPKGATDLADLRRLLLAHPELRSERGAVADALDRLGGGDEVAATWRELVQAPPVTDEEAEEGY